MDAKKLVKDALDYIFIDNGSPDSYLSSREVDSYFLNNSVEAVAAAVAVIDKSLAMETFYNRGGSTTDLSTLLNESSSYSNDDNNSNILYNNGSDLIHRNDTSTTAEDITELIRMVATSIVLGLMILITIIGNVFVIAAIILERNLQNVANYLVASLAVADLFVACLVMPLGAVYEISQGWILGPELCDIWTSCDVLCCTASILHLVAIATDRYWAVTNIDYIHARTSKRVFLMIFLVWFAAVIVSLAPQFGWKDPDYLQRIEQQKCMVSQDVGYQVFATCCTFYVPLLVILVLYWKIYQTARKRIHRRRPQPIDIPANNNQPHLTQKKKKRLRLRIGKFSADKGKSTLGLVEGNSTNTVNTVEDTEFSSSNVDNKSRTGIEVTTIFNNPDEMPTSSTTQIATVSHLVAIASQQKQQQQQQAAVTKNQHNQKLQHTHQQKGNQTTTQDQDRTEISIVNNIVKASNVDCTKTTTTDRSSSSSSSMMTTTPLTTTTTTKPIAATATIMTTDDVLADHQLQHLQDDYQQNQTPCSNGSGVGGAGHISFGATTSTSTTTGTSISALSPQTPINPNMPAGGGVGGSATMMDVTSAPTSTSNQVTPLPPNKHQHHHHLQQQQQQTEQQQHQNLSTVPNLQSKVTKRKETLEAKRERKAAKTLAIITGAFVVCWLPFFLMALLLPLCESCNLNDTIASFFLWLGYFNSTLNPVIYTIFSPEFRQAFKRILFGGHRPVHYRSGKI